MYSFFNLFHNRDGFLREIFAFLYAWRNILFSVTRSSRYVPREIEREAPWRRTGHDRRKEREKLLKGVTDSSARGFKGFRRYWIIPGTHRFMKYSWLKRNFMFADRVLTQSITVDPNIIAVLLTIDSPIVLRRFNPPRRY